MSKIAIVAFMIFSASLQAHAESQQACGREVTSLKAAAEGSTLEDVIKGYMDAGADIDICLEGDDTVVVGIFADRAEALSVKE